MRLGLTLRQAQEHDLLDADGKAELDGLPVPALEICSVLGGAKFITSDVDMLQKLRKSAADLGADAVILTKEGSTTASISTAAGSSSANLYANPNLATGSATGSWGAYGGTFEYARNMGIAIKFIQRS